MAGWIMNNIKEIRKQIKRMILQSREAGSSPALVGETKEEKRINFYLSLGLDKNGDIHKSDETDNL